MTGADDAGLLAELIAATADMGILGGARQPGKTTAAKRFEAARAALLDRYDTQRREIEELRRDIAKMTEMHLRSVTGALSRALRAEDELAKALKVIAPFAVFAENVDADGWISNIHREQISTWLGPSDFRAASAFAAKHGGRDGQS